MVKEYKSYTSTFKVGDRVEDRKDHARGTVVAKYKHPELADVVVVKWDECRDGIAVPTEDLRRARVVGSSGVLTVSPPSEKTHRLQRSGPAVAHGDYLSPARFGALTG